MKDTRQHERGRRVSRRGFLQQAAGGCLLLFGRDPLRAVAGAEDDAFARAAASAKIAGYSFSKVQRWLNEKALPAIDSQTGLYRADGQWNYRDTAADCYPFLCWAAHLVDRDALHGPVLDVLRAEERLCNHIGRIPVRFDWQTMQKDVSVQYDAYVFEASEYVKDGLIAIVEALGKGPWYERMKGIEEDLWREARIDTPFGKIPSTNLEVNGEQIQALVRLFTMSGDEQFLVWAERLADYYLAQEEFVPQRLRDHGCEIIGGLGLLLGVESEARPQVAAARGARLERMLDLVLERGANDDGMMFNTLGDPKSGLSDGWGYNYVAYLCHDMALGRDHYRARVEHALHGVAKPAYRDYAWEGTNIDGFADSIEGALYLLNRVPVGAALEWVDGEMARNVVRSSEPLATAPLWGTMKLESNGVRTTIMHALMHTQGTIARPWRGDLRLGAARIGNGAGAAVLLAAEAPWSGRLEFDVPRHRLYMGFERDWPRMNTLPEWFAVEPDRSYRVLVPGAPERVIPGRELHAGLGLELPRGGELRVEVRAG